MDSTRATEPESKLATTITKELVFSRESSSAPAAAPPRPFSLTPLAWRRLEKTDPKSWFVYDPVSCSSVPLPAQPDDIFADFDPNYHSVIVQQRHRFMVQIAIYAQHALGGREKRGKGICSCEKRKATQENNLTENCQVPSMCQNQFYCLV